MAGRLSDFERIFAEMGAQFDVWFFESQVEEEGKVIVQELLDKGVAEISEGLPVVKIDEKLGLTQRNVPHHADSPLGWHIALRHQGSRADQAKVRRFGVDRAIWIVDVRQSLYFQQIVKVLEIWGFEQARRQAHMSLRDRRAARGSDFLPQGECADLRRYSRSGAGPRTGNRSRKRIWEMAAEKQETVARQVGLGSLKYAMLARDNNKIVIFDLEEALSFEGHVGAVHSVRARPRLQDS